MSLPINFISTSTLEPWDWTNPWTKGIGGSETSHIEMCQRLYKRGFKIRSYAPVPFTKYHVDDVGVLWEGKDTRPDMVDGIFIWYRNPEKLDVTKGKHQKWWFIAQDVDYPGFWNEARLEKVDRYICLCHEHAMYTLGRYPSLKGRVFTSSNGIRSEFIRNLPTSSIERDPNRMLYPSSPDRGLKLLLENWWRIRERNPEATLAVAYGFNNMEVITKENPGDWRKDYQSHLEIMLAQPGIELLGRLPQQKLYEEWQKAGIWAHPTDFPETSCITCMEAQALGAFPVTNNLWALEDNVGHGWMVDGVPQKSELIRSLWMRSLFDAFSAKDAPNAENNRREMMEWALARFDWERMVDQWQRWLDADLKELKK